MLLRWNKRSSMSSVSPGSARSDLYTTLRRSTMSYHRRRGQERKVQAMDELVSHVLDCGVDDGVLAVPAHLQPNAVLDRVPQPDGVLHKALFCLGSQAVPRVSSAILPRGVLL